MKKQILVTMLLALTFALPASAGAPRGKNFDHVVFVLFENTNYSQAVKQPFFASLGARGALFTNFSALTHPSQGNYIALTSGSLNGVKTDGNYDIDAENVADLLEEQGLTWKVYAEDYPGNCYRGGSYKNYARKHNPFISYKNIQSNPKRCAQIVNAAEFDKDLAAGRLPNYVFYIPDGKNDGHDTGVAYADKWYENKFGPLLANPAFTQNSILVSTFDESGGGAKNQIYTSIVGPAVKPGVQYSQSVNIYALLRLVQDNWSLRSLRKEDATANPLPAIWK